MGIRHYPLTGLKEPHGYGGRAYKDVFTAPPWEGDTVFTRIELNHLQIKNKGRPKTEGLWNRLHIRPFLGNRHQFLTGNTQRKHCRTCNEN